MGVSFNWITYLTWCKMSRQSYMGHTMMNSPKISLVSACFILSMLPGSIVVYYYGIDIVSIAAGMLHVL